MNTTSLTYHVGRFPPECRHILACCGEDPCFKETTLNMLWDKQWLGILVSDGNNHFVHALSPSAIGTSDLYDVERTMDYAGPICTSDDPSFVSDAAACYSDWCREHRIIAELVRFSPHLQNARLFGRISNLKIDQPHRVAYMPLHAAESDLLAGYQAHCRAAVQTAKDAFDVRVIEKRSWEWDAFVRFYQNSSHVAANQQRWAMDERMLFHARYVDSAILVAAFDSDVMLSAALFLAGRPISHYFLVAASRNPARRPGADELVLHYAATLLAGMGSKAICLGGGSGAEVNNNRWDFKMSFGSYATGFAMGLWSHDTAAIRTLYAQAEAFDRSVRSQPFFLRYRAARPFAAGRMKPSLQALEIETSDPAEVYHS